MTIDRRVYNSYKPVRVHSSVQKVENLKCIGPRRTYVTKDDLVRRAEDVGNPDQVKVRPKSEGRTSNLHEQ